MEVTDVPFRRTKDVVSCKVFPFHEVSSGGQKRSVWTRLDLWVTSVRLKICVLFYCCTDNVSRVELVFYRDTRSLFDCHYRGWGHVIRLGTLESDPDDLLTDERGWNQWGRSIYRHGLSVSLGGHRGHNGWVSLLERGGTLSKDPGCGFEIVFSLFNSEEFLRKTFECPRTKYSLWYLVRPTLPTVCYLFQLLIDHIKRNQTLKFSEE